MRSGPAPGQAEAARICGAAAGSYSVQPETSRTPSGPLPMTTRTVLARLLALCCLTFAALPSATAQDAAASAQATSLSTQLDAADAALDAAKAAVSEAPDDADALAAQADAQAEVDRLAGELRTVVNTLDEQGVDVADYRAQLIRVQGAQGVEDLDAGAVMALASGWLDDGKTWLADNAPGLIVKAVIFLLVLLLFKVIAGWAGKLVGKALSSSRLNISDMLRTFFVGTTRKLVFLLGIMVAFSAVGTDLTPILAGLGIFGFVIGFALQDTLGNFAAGLMILLYRPFDVGDVVDAGGVTGKVENLSLVSTTMLTPDNQKIIVPNGAIWGGTIRNVTANPTRRVDLTLGVGYGDDLDLAKRVIREVVTAHELVLKDPEPQVEVSNLGESSVDFIVRPWCKTGDYWTVYFDLTKALKERCDKEGLNIPFPQRDVHLHQVAAD